MTIRRVVRGIPTLLSMGQGAGPLGEQRDVAVAFDETGVAWIGPDAQAPDAPEVVDGTGCVALPPLVDCHTHTVWAGSRSDEFRQRLSGVHYSEILEAGGGILSTVRQTRTASESTLVALAAARLSAMRRRGVGTVEIKSGYGLSVADERKLLIAAGLAGKQAGVTVLRTFLGAHAVPAEHRADRSAYVEQVIHEQLPEVQAHADFIDAYIDRGAFTVDEGRRILEAGRGAGLGVRVHAEQVAYTGAAEMAAGLGALSCDHLERLDADGVHAMAAAGTVGVMLPGAMLYLKDPAPPVAQLREAGVPLAVATDLNPGSSPSGDLWRAMTLACVLMGLTVEEALRGATCVAADALGLASEGRLAIGSSSLILCRPQPGEPPEAASLVQFLDGPAEVRWVQGG